MTVDKGVCLVGFGLGPVPDPTCVGHRCKGLRGRNEGGEILVNPYRKNVRTVDDDGLVHLGFEVRPFGEATGNYRMHCRAEWTRETTQEVITCLACLANTT